MRTIQELATLAINVQDALDLSEVVKSWSDALGDLWANGNAGNIPAFNGTSSINLHPVNVLFTSRVMSLVGYNSEIRRSGWDECFELSKYPDDIFSDEAEARRQDAIGRVPLGWDSV